MLKSLTAIVTPGRQLAFRETGPLNRQLTVVNSNLTNAASAPAAGRAQNFNCEMSQNITFVTAKKLIH
jgi:hypothetical protein